MESDALADIPYNPDQLTNEWIRRNTGFNPIDGSIKVKDNIQDGIGFLSNMCRVSFQTEDGETRNILVKLLPDNPAFRALTIDEEFDKKEILFYSLVKPEIVELVPDIKSNMCNYYGGKFTETEDLKNYASMLIIEDLKPLGYQNLNPESEDWEINLQKVLVFLAKLHTAGFALERNKSSKISEIFPFCWGAADDTKVGLLKEVEIRNSSKLKDFMHKFNFPEEVVNPYVRILDNISKFSETILKKGSIHPCLIHGDLWQPNIMVSSVDAPIKAIDWQLFGYRDPVYEVVIVLLTSMPLRVLKEINVISKYAKFYYNELLKTCKSYRVEKCVERNEEEFMQFFNSWGMAYAFLWFLWSFESFPNGEDRLYEVFMVLEKNYKISDVLQKDM